AWLCLLALPLAGCGEELRAPSDDLDDGSSVGSGGSDPLAGVGGQGLGNGTGGSTGGGSTQLPGSGGATNQLPGSGGTTSGSGGADSGTGGEDAGSGGSTASCIPGGTGTMDVGSSSFLDLSTCLTWQKEDTATGSITNRGAALHCSELSQDGLSWRLPTAVELRSYPEIGVENNAYLAGPVMIQAGADPATGCAANSHSCNLTQYSEGNFACTWQGPGGGAYAVLCVSGSSDGATLDTAFESSCAASCSNSSGFEEANCNDYQ
ncbi:MAG: DUF1566 domain-containing protein, partial [Polyangiaceae bacterium]|nr:DUF1566 domain-containing protein [Polyangiaceae bacterium]